MTNEQAIRWAMDGHPVTYHGKMYWLESHFKGEIGLRDNHPFAKSNSTFPEDTVIFYPMDVISEVIPFIP